MKEAPSSFRGKVVQGAALAGLLGVMPAAACELDGLSHGYGPMSALFAGAHRYQALNGLQEDEDLPLEEAPAAAPAEAASVSADASLPPPRRSFVAWAKAKPKAPGASDAPASWVRPDAPASADPSRRSPEANPPQGGEQEQAGPSGGPVP